MQGRFHHLYRDEQGMSFVYVGMGFMGFLAASTLAIDVGMFMTARAQAQNAADAGALAGAVALVQNSYTDRSGSGPAVQSAINTAQSNQIIGGAPSVVTGDVSFPVGPTGQSNRVQVQVYRSTERGNAMGTVLVLRAGTGDQINPSFYFSWKMPGDTGGSFYRDNIANCNQTVIRTNDPIIQEPGDKSGPTIQGINDLIAKDPNAYWDTSCVCVKGSAYGSSPRVFPIPMYDPAFYATGKANGRVADFKVANF